MKYLTIVLSRSDCNARGIKNLQAVLDESIAAHCKQTAEEIEQALQSKARKLFPDIICNSNDGYKECLLPS